MTEPEKIRILVAGINYQPNQFSRELEKYGCVPIHVNGDPNGQFPHFCDAAIVVSSYSSHARYWAVKDVYKKDGKRCFLTGTGFSQIREDFENFLKERRGFVRPPERKVEVTVTAGELKVPSAWVAKVAKKEEVPVNKVTVKPGPRGLKYSDETLNRIYSEIDKAWQSNKTLQSAADELNKAGIKKTNGTHFKYSDIAQLRHSPAYKIFTGAPIKVTEKAGLKITQVAKYEKEDTPVIGGMNLIQQVTVSSLPLTEKIELIHRITLGEITNPETTERIIVDNQLVIEKVSILRPKAENPHVTLTREQANLVLSNLAAINSFIEGKSL